jgi:hypothetical protein
MGVMGVMGVMVNLRAKRLSTFIVRSLSISVRHLHTVVVAICEFSENRPRQGHTVVWVCEWHYGCGCTVTLCDSLQVNNTLVVSVHYVAECTADSPVNQR